MDIDEASKVLDNIRYKDGWDFALVRSELDDNYRLWIRWRVPDVLTGRQTTVGSYEVIWPEMLDRFNELNFLKYIRHLIHKAELHESDEWFRYKNEQIFDPHAGQDD